MLTEVRLLLSYRDWEIGALSSGRDWSCPFWQLEFSQESTLREGGLVILGMCLELLETELVPVLRLRPSCEESLRGAWLEFIQGLSQLNEIVFIK